MKGLVLLALLSVPLRVCAAGLAAPSGQVVALESFEEYPLLAFPGQWRVRGDENKARLIYRVAAEQGDHFLHAYADHQAIQIGIVHSFRPREFPLLRWRWRVTQLPCGGDERRNLHLPSAGIGQLVSTAGLPDILDTYRPSPAGD